MATTSTQHHESRYTIVSADCHAGGSMEQYAEYLDPAWREEFDAWRTKYRTRGATSSTMKR
jgi:hypothetical protein